MSDRRKKWLRQLALSNLLGGAGGANYETPSYDNAGGTGDRTALITITSTGDFFNGDSALMINGNIADNAFYFDSTNAQNRFIAFQFTHAVIITETKFYTDATLAAQGTWKWQGSNNGTDWTDISASFTLGGDANPSVSTVLSGNTTAYTYYRLFGISGLMSAASWVNEFEFKIGNPL